MCCSVAANIGPTDQVASCRPDTEETPCASQQPFDCWRSDDAVQPASALCASDQCQTAKEDQSGKVMLACNTFCCPRLYLLPLCTGTRCVSESQVFFMSCHDLQPYTNCFCVICSLLAVTQMPHMIDCFLYCKV